MNNRQLSKNSIPNIKIDSVGWYEIESTVEGIHSVEITEREGELGIWFELSRRFVPVSKFRGVTVISKLSEFIE